MAQNGDLFKSGAVIKDFYVLSGFTLLCRIFTNLTNTQVVFLMK